MKTKILDTLKNIWFIFHYIIYPIFLWVFMLIHLFNKEYVEAIFWAIMILVEKVSSFTEELKEIDEE